MRTAIVALLLALTGSGCGSGTAAVPEAGPGTPTQSSGSSAQATVEIELRFDETVEARGLKLRWLELQDSRCALGVVCIWEGQAVVTLEAARGEDGPAEVKLVHRANREPEPARAFGRELRLLGVDPYPQEGVTPERGDHVARIQITES